MDGGKCREAGTRWKDSTQNTPREGQVLELPHLTSPNAIRIPQSQQPEGSRGASCAEAEPLPSVPAPKRVVYKRLWSHRRATNCAREHQGQQRKEKGLSFPSHTFKGTGTTRFCQPACDLPPDSAEDTTIGATRQEGAGKQEVRRRGGIPDSR